MEEEVRDLTLGGRALRMLLEARRRASSEEAEAPGRRDGGVIVGERGGRGARERRGVTVSTTDVDRERDGVRDMLRRTRVGKRGAGGDDAVRRVARVSRGGIKQWLLGHDDSCPLCRRALPVWLGRPQYS